MNFSLVFSVALFVARSSALSSIPALRLHITLTSSLISLLTGILYSCSIISSFSCSFNPLERSVPIKRCNSYFSSCSGNSSVIPISTMLSKSIFPFQSYGSNISSLIRWIWLMLFEAMFIQIQILNTCFISL